MILSIVSFDTQQDASCNCGLGDIHTSNYTCSECMLGVCRLCMVGLGELHAVKKAGAADSIFPVV